MAVALAALVVAVWAVAPSGDEVELPRPLEAVFPLPGDTVVRQTAVEVDLPVGYTLEMSIDGITISSAEIAFTAGTGRYQWQPGPGRLFEVWEGGEHTITAQWNRTSGGPPDAGEFEWTFRVT